MSNLEFNVEVSFPFVDEEYFQAVVSVSVGFKALGYHRIGEFIIREPEMLCVEKLQEVLDNKIAFYDGDDNFSISRQDDQLTLGCSTSGSGNDGSIEIYLPFNSCIKFINDLIAWKNAN